MKAYQDSIEAARKSDVLIIIGTTGEVMPASQIPILAKENGAIIIEVNIEESNYTGNTTDIFLPGKATYILDLLSEELGLTEAVN